MVIKWTEPAFSDLNDFKSISQKENVSDYIMKLFEYSQQLKEFPKLGRIYHYYKKIIIRKLVYKEHSILYYIDEDIIYIIAVIHHKQDIIKKLKTINSLLKGL